MDKGARNQHGNLQCSRLKKIQNNRFFPHCTSTHINTGDITSMHHSLMFFKFQLFYKQFACEMVRSAQQLFAVDKMAAQEEAAQGISIRKIAETVGVPLRTAQPVAASAALGGRDLQASGIESGRKAEHWPAKQVMWVKMVICSATFTSRPLLQVKYQRLSALNKRRHLQWCTSMLQRLGETKRPHLGICSSVLGSQRGVFPACHGCCPRETTRGQADASCSRRAAARRRLVRRVVFPAARATHCGLCFPIVFVSAPVAVSLSLPRIWVSRSTSKTDADDDDESPLR